MSSYIFNAAIDAALVRYFDYRFNTARDLSGNGGGGTPTDIQWTHGGVKFPAPTSKFTVADAPELQIDTALTLVSFVDFKEFQSDDRFISKRDAGGTNYELHAIVNGTRLAFAVQGANSFNPVIPNLLDSKYIAVGVNSGELPDFYKDGNFAAAGTTITNLTVNDAPLLIGNRYTNTNRLASPMQAALVFNRKLTATEHSIVYGTLAATKAPSKIVGHATDPTALWKTDHGAIASQEPVSSGPISNTPFQNDTGSQKVVDDIIDEIPVKTIENVSDGSYSLKTSHFQQTPSEAAYGEFEFWIKKNDPSDTFNISFIGDEHVSGIIVENGYAVSIGSTEQVRIWRVTGGAVSSVLMQTANDTIVIGQWYHFRIVRLALGVTTVYLDGVLMAVVSGTNPATDNTHITSNIWYVEGGTGDKLAHSDIAGNHSIVKTKG